MKHKKIIWIAWFCELLLISPESIPVYLHSQGKRYQHFQMVFFEENRKKCIVILKGE